MRTPSSSRGWQIPLCGVARWVALFGASSALAEAGFFVRDGDRIVVVGDSITVEGHYVRYLDNFLRTRFPTWTLAVRNSGTNGQVAQRALAAFDTDVFAWRPTVAIVNFGMNDGRRAGGAEFYRSGIVPYVERLQGAGLRVVLCSNSPLDLGDAPGAFTDYNRTFAEMAAFSAGFARERGLAFVDQFNFCHRVWGENRRRAEPIPVSHQTTVPYPSDFVHARGPGQTTMAYIILKSLGAPAEVGWAELDFATGAARGRRSRIADFRRSSDGSTLTFTRTDEASPCWIDDRAPFPGSLGLELVPFTEELNRLPLHVRGLVAGRYELAIDDVRLGVFTAQQFADGVNLAADLRSPVYAPGRRVDAAIRRQTSTTKAAREVAFLQPPSWLKVPDLAAQREREWQRRVAEVDTLDAVIQAAAMPAPYTCRLTRLP